MRVGTLCAALGHARHLTGVQCWQSRPSARIVSLSVLLLSCLSSPPTSKLSSTPCFHSLVACDRVGGEHVRSR